MSALFNSNIFSRDEGVRKKQVVMAISPSSFIRSGVDEDLNAITYANSGINHGDYFLSKADNNLIIIPLNLPDNCTVTSAILYGSHTLVTKFGMARASKSSAGYTAMITPGLVGVERPVEGYGLIDNENYNYFLYTEDFMNLNYLYGGSVTYTIGVDK